MWKPVPHPDHILHMFALEQHRCIGFRFLVIEGRDTDPEACTVILPTDTELWIAAPVVHLDLARCGLDRPLDQVGGDTHSLSIDHGIPHFFPEHFQCGRRVNAYTGGGKQLHRILMDILDLFFSQQCQAGSDIIH